MHIRRLASILLGAWIFTGAFLAVIAMHNMHAMDRLLTAPPRMAGLSIEALGESTARTFLRFYSSELNRWYFDIWEIVQIVLGVCLIAALSAGGNGRRSSIVLGSLMLAMVLILHFAIAPELNRVGRVLDFFPANRQTPDRGRYSSFQTAYVVVEGIKALFGLLLLSSLLRMHGGRSKTMPEKPHWVKAR